MSWPPENQILIDCNVFVHLCTRDENFNADGHVSTLLASLAAESCTLLVDDGGAFKHEYDSFVTPHFQRESEVGADIPVLRYWMDPQNHTERRASGNRQLSRAIATVIVENEQADRAYVYISFSEGSVLVTNDENHIVLGPRHLRNPERRQRLFTAARRQVAEGAAIMFSREAVGELD